MKVRQSQILEENEKAVQVDSGDEEDGMIVRTMLYIPEIGFSISIYGIETIDKTFRVKESTHGTGEVKPQYGIVFNKDMDKSMRYPRTNIEFWFDSEEIRDQRYTKIVRHLSAAGFKFMEV
jgi:hypothetical protein